MHYDAGEALTERLERAQTAMESHEVDAMIVSPSSDLVYLLGYPAHTSERLTALLLPQSGRPALILPRLEAPRIAGRAGVVDLLAWAETTDPIDLAARWLTASGARTIAVGEELWSGFLLRFQSALPEARFVSAAPVLRGLRVVKTAAEVGFLREAGERTDRVWEEFVATTALRGLTERQAAKIIAGLMDRAGLGDPAFLICASGPHSASPHHLVGDRVIEDGDAVVFDFGGNVEGYKSDITRTVHAGAPSPEFRTVYDTVERARSAAFAAVRPGATCASIDRAAREAIEAAGYGDYFIHRVGHGLGLDVHEEPYLVAGNETQLREGMVFSDEPGVYLPGRFGVRIEDSVVCTASGAELLNHARRDLVVMS